MILLRLISWPYARRHLLRVLLTTAGIILGVGVFVGMRTANKSRRRPRRHRIPCWDRRPRPRSARR